MTGTLALVFSAVAVIISASTFAFNVRSRRRDLFLTMHERLLDDDVRRGRRALLSPPVSSVEEARALRDRSGETYELASRALAMLDVLGCYVYRGYISKSLVLEEWGHTYAQLWLAGRHIIEMRLEDDGGLWSAWPHLQRLGEESLAWVEQQPDRRLIRQPDPGT
jgi:hypothetical protein